MKENYVFSDLIDRMEDIREQHQGYSMGASGNIYEEITPEEQIKRNLRDKEVQARAERNFKIQEYEKQNFDIKINKKTNEIKAVKENKLGQVEEEFIIQKGNTEKLIKNQIKNVEEDGKEKFGEAALDLPYYMDDPEAIVFEDAFMMCTHGSAGRYIGLQIFDQDIQLSGGNKVATSNDEKAENFLGCESLECGLTDSERCNNEKIANGFWIESTLGEPLFANNKILLMTTTRICERGGELSFYKNGLARGSMGKKMFSNYFKLLSVPADFLVASKGGIVMKLLFGASGTNSGMTGIYDFLNLNYGDPNKVGEKEVLPDLSSEAVIFMSNVENEKDKEDIKKAFNKGQGVIDLSTIIISFTRFKPDTSKVEGASKAFGKSEKILKSGKLLKEKPVAFGLEKIGSFVSKTVSSEQTITTKAGKIVINTTKHTDVKAISDAVVKGSKWGRNIEKVADKTAKIFLEEEKAKDIYRIKIPE